MALLRSVFYEWLPGSLPVQSYSKCSWKLRQLKQQINKCYLMLWFAKVPTAMVLYRLMHYQDRTFMNNRHAVGVVKQAIDNAVHDDQAVTTTVSE